MDRVINFYKGYFQQSLKEATAYKIDFLDNLLEKRKVYKFIAFDDNEDLNELKFECIKHEKLWFSHYIYLNDKTEFEIKYDQNKISKVTGVNPFSIYTLVEDIKELYDVCSFSYECKTNMWEDYANHGNGICIVFDVVNLDMLFPVAYIEKKRIDFNQLLIKSYLMTLKEKMNRNDPMSILPYVIKNPMNGELASYKENEVRILFPSFDDGDFNNGIVYPQVKVKNGYKGQSVGYDKCDLKINKIIIGKACNIDMKKSIIHYCDDKNIFTDYNK